MPPAWCHSPFFYTRRTTREVKVGDVGVGGRNPIRVQSMTTPPTTDTKATADQIARLVEAGCEIVRVTVPTSADARNLPAIRRELKARRISVPLVADIHFSPGAALKAVEHVEKIRVNPGNYADRKQFAVREYTDAEYDSELARLAETFRPLVLRAQQLGVAMRIGTNHGSLSDRILNRYGDTPMGMVESALEFVRICEHEGYRELIISMKSSNPVVTIEAYRLLAARMSAETMDYPFHLGVTEAGDGADGRIKSAIGIGSLLDDGIGDTIRVSLTEDPVEELPVAHRLVEPYNRRLAHLRGEGSESRVSAPEARAAGGEDRPQALPARGAPAHDLRPGVRGRLPVPASASASGPEPSSPRNAERVECASSASPGSLSLDSSAVNSASFESASLDSSSFDSLSFDPFSYTRRQARRIVFGPCAAGGEETVRVEIRLRSPLSDAAAIRAEIDSQAGPRVPLETRADLVEVSVASAEDLARLAVLRNTLRLVAPGVALSAAFEGALPGWMLADREHGADRPPAGQAEPLKGSSDLHGSADRIVLPAEALLRASRGGGPGLGDLLRRSGCPVLLEGSAATLLELLALAPFDTFDPDARPTRAAGDSPIPLALTIPTPLLAGASHVHEYRRLAAGLAARGLDLPIVLSCDTDAVGGDPLLGPSLILGSLLCDGIGDSVRVRAGDSTASRALAFNILQGARVRISKTEFISCPSCGRTLFDLEETTRRIKARTAHLKGLKIAVMGCVVNGPGEMADADFGYVGWGTDKIALFVGKELVARDIPTGEADDRLVALIKQHGKWQEPVLAGESAS